MSPVETPSFVLRQFRRVMFPSKNQIGFGLAVGWGGDVQRRLEEENGTLFTKNHLDQLVAGKMLTVDSSWYRRFETAMVGEEWPQRTVTAEVKDGQVVVPLNLSALKGPTKIVFQLVLVAVLMIGLAGFQLFRSGYIPGHFPKDKEVRSARKAPMLVGGGEAECQRFVGITVAPLFKDRCDLYPEGCEPFIVGDSLEIGVLTYGDCYHASRLFIDGELFGWSTLWLPYPWDESLGSHEAGYFWNTYDAAPGEHQIRVEFIPVFRPFSFARVEVEERTVTLEGVGDQTTP